MSFKCQSCSRTFPNKQSNQARPERLVVKERLIVNVEPPRQEIAEERSLCAECAERQRSVGPTIVRMAWGERGLVPASGVSA